MKYKDDCFAIHVRANGEKSCSALKDINCDNCNFYRSDIKKSKIEADVSKYPFSSTNYKKGK